MVFSIVNNNCTNSLKTFQINNKSFYRPHLTCFSCWEFHGELNTLSNHELRPLQKGHSQPISVFVHPKDFAASSPIPFEVKLFRAVCSRSQEQRYTTTQ